MMPLCPKCGEEIVAIDPRDSSVCLWCFIGLRTETTTGNQIKLAGGSTTDSSGISWGYHVREIPRGELGEVSKIEEEFEEFLDATDQGLAIMQLVELSDLLGAIEAWLQKYHPNVTLDQVARFKDATVRAFRSGRRG